MAILVSDKHSAKKEIDFELQYLARLTVKQRFEMMLRKSAEMMRLLGARGHGKSTKITERF